MESTEICIALLCIDDPLILLVGFIYRLLKVPVVYRHDYEEDGKQKKETFGHPNILYLPSVMSGEFLFESVDRVVPFISNYSILLTDGQVCVLNGGGKIQPIIFIGPLNVLRHF